MKKVLVILTVFFLLLLNARAWSFWGTHTKKCACVKIPALYSDDAGTMAVKNELDDKLKDFTENPHINEFYVQHILDLLYSEMTIVDHLLLGHSGYRVECALNDRNKRLSSTIPSVVSLFDSIVNAALFEPRVLTQHNRDMSYQCRFTSMKISCNYKWNFLHKAYETLDDYYVALRDFQFELAREKDRA